MFGTTGDLIGKTKHRQRTASLSLSAKTIDKWGGKLIGTTG
jgi:hypothetical protein